MKIPVFATEQEEASWWYEYRFELGDDLVQASRESKNGPGSLGRRKQKVEQMAAEQASAAVESVKS